MNKSLKGFMLFLPILVLLLNASAMAQTYVVVKNGVAKRYDAGTGAYKGTVGSVGAIAASSDGETIAVVSKHGSVRRYGVNGAYRGQVGSGKAVGVQVSGEVVIVTSENGSVRRYEAKTGAYRGSN